MLVLTDERGVESVFGFFRIPEQIRDRAGKVLAEVPNANTGLLGRSSIARIHGFALSSAGFAKQVMLNPNVMSLS